MLCSWYHFDENWETLNHEEAATVYDDYAHGLGYWAPNQPGDEWESMTPEEQAEMEAAYHSGAPRVWGAWIPEDSGIVKFSMDSVDTDHDGLVSWQEAKRAMHSGEAETDGIFEWYDWDKDHKIDREEFT